MQRLKGFLPSSFEPGDEAKGKLDLGLGLLLEEGLQTFAVLIPGFEWTVMRGKVG